MADSDYKTIDLDADLSARLSALASESGQPLDVFAQTILRRHADAQERLQAEYEGDEQRWQRYKKTGNAIPAGTARQHLQSLLSCARVA